LSEEVGINNKLNIRKALPIYGLRSIPWISGSSRKEEFNNSISIGLQDIVNTTDPGFTSNIASFDQISLEEIDGSCPLLLVDFGGLSRVHQKAGAEKECIFEKAFSLVRTISDLCTHCQSVTFIRTVSRAIDNEIDDELYESLCTGALRSLQSEHPNLQVAELGFKLDTVSNEEVYAAVKRVYSSANFPSDLVLDQGSNILARSTFSLRNGFESYSCSNLPEQWSTIYVFGGASAITVECLMRVAGPSSEIHLFGRRRYDQVENDIPDVLNISSVQDYILKNEPDNSKDLATLRSRTKFLESQIELSRSIRDLRSLGATVYYHRCDITKEEDLRSALLEIESTGGKSATSVLFSAGLLRDSLVRNMEERDFVDVAAVKCKGLQNVLKECSLADCQALYVFGSVSGTYGNKGQANYSGANEALFRLAEMYSARRTDMKTVVFNWGPWGEVGMAEPEVNAQFARRGINPLATQQGVNCFLYAANIKGTGFFSPVCGYAPWNDLELTFNTGLAPDLESVYLLRKEHILSSPALTHFKIEEGNGEGEISIMLSLEECPLFSDHILGSNYVVPFAFFVEIFFESFSRLYPDEIPGLKDIRCLRGVQVPLSEKHVSLSVRLEDESSSSPKKILVFVKGSDIPSYTAVVDCKIERESNSDTGRSPDANFLEKQLPDIASLYKDYLFHGPVYQVLDRLISVDSGSITANVCLSGLASDLGFWTEGHWLCPPPLFDSVAQLALVWRRMYDDKTALPSSVSRIVASKADRLSGELSISLINIIASEYDMTFDVSIADMTGDEVLYAQCMKCTCSESLNRLNKEWVESMNQRSFLAGEILDV